MDGAAFKHVFVAVVLNIFYLNVVDAVKCYYSSSSFTRRTSGYMYCSTSCCGSSSNRYCCEHTGFSVLGIVGIVMAVLVGVSVVVCIVCCRRRRSAPGQIVMTQQQTQVIGFGVVGNMNPAYTGTTHAPYTGNVNVQHAGPMSYGTSGTGSEGLPRELNAGTLASPPAYESVSSAPAEEPPKYSSIYNK